MSFKTIQFVLPDVIICLNGTVPEKVFFERMIPIPIAAADGAAKKLRERGITPSYIVGDLDSIFEELNFWREQKGIIIHEVSDQNSTDYEKTIAFVRERGSKNILVCGLHGGDLDHTLNNWSITKRESASTQALNLAIFDNGKTAFSVRESIQFDAGADDMISLIPQPKVRLTTSGLEWNLNNEELELGRREGARNRATAPKVRLEIHAGELFLFLKANLPYMPIIA
ncbi:MAG: thiamine diphosphokinase [Candidatus Kapaibacterium sp.]|nr:MAG: thiamine diphosphokinase [Candidatus Kapabacteria bacterium]